MESGQTLQGSFSAVSKLYLQIYTHMKALAEIYTMRSFAPFLESIIETGPPFSTLNVFR